MTQIYYKLEANILGISEELRKRGYVIEQYKGIDQKLKEDGLNVTKKTALSTQRGMIGSEWLCGIIRYDERRDKNGGGFTLKVNETPFDQDLFKTLRNYLEF